METEKRITENEKRIVTTEKKRGLSTADLMLAAILLAAGQVLKTTVGTLIASATSGAIKPNFIIAMYCLVVLLTNMRLLEAAIIGLLAGALNQIAAATPLINFGSELVGAVVMCLLVKIPLGKLTKTKQGVIKSAPATFISTLFSGFTFVGLQYLLLYSNVTVLGKAISLPPTYFKIFLGVIFGTAAINAVIVLVLYAPLKVTLKRND